MNVSNVSELDRVNWIKKLPSEYFRACLIIRCTLLENDFPNYLCKAYAAVKLRKDLPEIPENGCPQTTNKLS